MTAHDAHAAAVQAAAEALALIPGTTVAYPLSVARTVVAAVAPILAAAERQRIAAAIRAECLRKRHHDMSFRVPAFDHTDNQPSGRVCRYCEPAARIAEGDPNVTRPTAATTTPPAGA